MGEPDLPHAIGVNSLNVFMPPYVWDNPTTTTTQALADRLRGLLPGLPPYPATAFPYDGAATSPVAGVGAVAAGVPGGMEMSQENLHHVRTQLQVGY